MNEFSEIIQFSGPWKNPVHANIQYVLGNDKLVTIKLPQVLDVSNEEDMIPPCFIESLNHIAFPPSGVLTFPVYLKNNNTNDKGTIEIDTEGYISIKNTDNTKFTPQNSLLGMWGCDITYMCSKL